MANSFTNVMIWSMCKIKILQSYCWRLVKFCYVKRILVAAHKKVHMFFVELSSVSKSQRINASSLIVQLMHTLIAQSIGLLSSSKVFVTVLFSRQMSLGCNHFWDIFHECKKTKHLNYNLLYRSQSWLFLAPSLGKTNNNNYY